MAKNTSSGSKPSNNSPKPISNPNWPSKTGGISGGNRGNNPPKK